MDKSEKKILMKSIIRDVDTKFFETFNRFELILDESFFDYDLLKVALDRKSETISNFLINKGCRVRNPNETNLEETPLHLAMKLDNASIVTAILKKGASIYDKNLKGETPLYAAFKNRYYRAVCAILDYVSNCPLSINPDNKDDVLHFHIACITKHISSIKLYLSFGFDINSYLSVDLPKYSGLTPLLYLLSKDDYSNISEFVKLFVNSGVDVNSQIPLHRSVNAGFTPLHFAVKNVCLELVELFLKNGADCNRTDKKGKTPLHVACKIFECDEALKIIEVLLDYSACPTAVDKSGNTPIHLTFGRILHHCSDEANILDKLISKQSLKVNLTDKHGLSYFHIICTRNEPDLVNHFLNSGVQIDSCVSSFGSFWSGYTALHFAVVFNQIAVVEVLLKRNASIDIKTYLDDCTPLHLACEFTRLKFYEAYRKYEEALLASNKPMSVDWISNRTSQLDIIKLLLLHGADVEAKNAANDTPLFVLYMVDKDAVSMYPDFFVNISINEINIRLIEITKILLSSKVNINSRNHKQETILHTISFSDLPKITDELMEFLITEGADINAVDARGLTPLHCAAKWSKDELVQTFLKHKANINVKSKKFETPLQMAISSYKYVNHQNDENDTEESNLLESSQSCITILLENGSDVNTKTQHGTSLLHNAVQFYNVFLVEKLLYYGADINVEDSRGNSIVCFSFENVEVDRMNVLCTIFIHVQKLLALGLYVNDKVQNFCVYLHQYCKTERNTSYEKILDTALDECRNELKRMKIRKIDNYTSLYNVLLKNPHELSKCVRNQSFIDIFERENIEEQFPLYSYLLKLQYKKCLLRSNVLKFAKESLIYLIQLLIKSSDLPDLCYDLILRYLTNEEVVNLKVAVGVTETGSSKRKLNIFDLSETEQMMKKQCFEIENKM